MHIMAYMCKNVSWVSTFQSPHGLTQHWDHGLQMLTETMSGDPATHTAHSKLHVTLRHGASSEPLLAALGPRFPGPCRIEMNYSKNSCLVKTHVTGHHISSYFMSLYVFSKCPTSTIKNLCICSRFRGLCLGTKYCGTFKSDPYCNHLQSASNSSLWLWHVQTKEIENMCC